MLRILMIGPEPHVGGGISAVAGALLESDLPQRCRLTYLAEGARRRGPGVKLVRFLTALGGLVRRLAQGQVDVVHLHVGGGSSLYRHALYLALSRLAGRPAVLHWHLPAEAASADQGGRVARWMLHRAAVVIALSPSWQAALADLAGRDRVVLLPNPVDCAAIRPPADPTARSEATVLFLGDFSARKGAADLVAAAALVLAQRPDARFVLCGGRPPPALQQRAAALGPAVSFPGVVQGDAKRGLLQEAAVLALPSYAEGLPVALLEAMAAGLPVVATPVGGIPDLVQEPDHGLLVPPGDAAALAAAILRLLGDADLRRAIGRRNRWVAETRFDVKVYVERLLAVYEGMVWNSSPRDLRVG
ncbi:MAG: glycosyltransferase family 4 protein [Caldilineales bacterium]|nr:glycosyltransferase family 4 protein [Caldilineales bacterium]MDW8318020.1 glycosyltransferase family 4 protein [Anaerolineae bacterium]